MELANRGIWERVIYRYKTGGREERLDPPGGGYPLTSRHLVFQTSGQNLHKRLSYKSISTKGGDFKNGHFLGFFSILELFLG